MIQSTRLQGSERAHEATMALRVWQGAWRGGRGRGALVLGSGSASVAAASTSEAATGLTGGSSGGSGLGMLARELRRSIWMDSDEKGGRAGADGTSARKNAPGGRESKTKDVLSTPGFYDNLIQKYATQQDSEQVNMKKLFQLGKTVSERPGVVLENAQFLQKELPKRLAKRLLDLQVRPPQHTHPKPEDKQRERRKKRTSYWVSNPARPPTRASVKYNLRRNGKEGNGTFTPKQSS